MSDLDAYRVGSQNLQEPLRHFRSGGADVAFDLMTTILRKLPAPTSSSDTLRLQRSGLGRTLAEIVGSIERESTEISKVAGAEPPAEVWLRALWDATVGLASSLSALGFMRFLLAVSRGAKQNPALFDEVYSSAMKNRGSWNSDIDPQISAETLFHAAERAVTVGQDLALAQALRIADLMEIPLLPWQWTNLTNTAGNARSADHVVTLWKHAKPISDHFQNQTWQALVLAAGRKRCNDILLEMWHCYMGRRLAIHVLREFAKAATMAQCPDLLESIWTSAKTTAPIALEQLASFAAAAGNLNNAVVFGDICDQLHAHGESLASNGQAIGELASAARKLNDAVRLKEIVGYWRPDGDLFTNQHAVWGTLFGAAIALKDEKLFLGLFRDFETRFDPLRYADRGTLQTMLWKATPHLGSAAAREVRDRLSYFSLDPTQCFLALQVEPLPLGAGKLANRFDGAGRCLMRWLISGYFRLSNSEYRERLTRVVLGLSALEENRRLAAWSALLARGQEAYVGHLRGRAIESVTEELRQLRMRAGDQIAAEIGDPRRFLQTVTDIVRDGLAGGLQPPPSILQGEPASRVLPILELFKANQTDLFNRHRWRPEEYFSAFSTAFATAQVSTFSSEDWIKAIDWILSSVAEHGRSLLHAYPGEDPVHALKNDLQNWYIPLMQALSPEDSKQFTIGQEVCSRALQIISMSNGIRAGKPVSANIANSMRKFQSRVKRLVPDAKVDLPKSFMVAAWHGARTEVIEPMLAEIMMNAYHALESLDPSDRRYEIRLDPAEGEERLAVLTIKNTYGRSLLNPYSTGKGRFIVHRLASMLHNSSARGRAETDDSFTIDGITAFAWYIYLPLPDAYLPSDDSPSVQEEAYHDE